MLPAACVSRRHQVEVEKLPTQDSSDAAWALHLSRVARRVGLEDDSGSCEQPPEVAPGLYLGSIQEASREVLEVRGVDCVLCLAPGGCGPSSGRGYPQSWETCDIDAEDAIDYDLFAQDMPRAIDFIDRCMLQGRRVLVHCHMGMNRSAAVCAVWMLRRQHRPLGDIVRHLATMRGLVFTNTQFLVGAVRVARELGILADRAGEEEAKVAGAAAHGILRWPYGAGEGKAGGADGGRRRSPVPRSAQTIPARLLAQFDSDDEDTQPAIEHKRSRTPPPQQFGAGGGSGTRGRVSGASRGSISL